MNDKEINHLKHIFDEFERKTGYKLDEYGDLILNVGALQNLLMIINSHINMGSDKERANSHYKLKAIIEKAIRQNRQIAFYGD